MQALSESKEVEIHSIFDSSEENLRSALSDFPSAQPVKSYDELLEQKIDGIVIATPSAQHAKQAIEAFEKNIPVFCQKPLGRSASEVSAVLRAAETADCLLGIDLSYRHTAAMESIYREIQSGTIGEIYAIDLLFHNAYGPDKAWFYNPALSGGGCVMDLGIHMIDLALYSLDFPKIESVSSKLFSKGKPLRDRTKEVEDYALSTLRLSNGAVVQLACSWNLSAGVDAIIQANFYGTKGGLSFKNISGSFYHFSAEKYLGTSSSRLCEPPDAWSGRAAVRWVQKLKSSRRFDSSAREFQIVADVLDRIYLNP